MKNIAKLVVGSLVAGLLVASSMADTNFVVVVPATQSQTMILSAIVTETSCIYLPPAYTTAMYRVMFIVQKQDGTILRTDAIRITPEELAAVSDSTINNGIAELKALVNAKVSQYVSTVSTNSEWLNPQLRAPVMRPAAPKTTPPAANPKSPKSK